ncbi:integral membrane [Fusarium albosuccineum]|uniref:Integral membrane n=1 Tax=Fusarium albosuccineum TaxID=1237068 RepID=A0A8H4P7C9_9HYPO|nr:integral membrane [Fusarium albosuccineum]
MLDDLKITFHRTIRVPDNDETNDLPPSMGHFPLFSASDYAKKLPPNMAMKGGLFFPMYQHEAMWIEFESNKCYAIKIYVGNVNAISGEPATETAATSLRRRNLLKNNVNIQDYVVVPGQKWLDGIAVELGKVRQFVAMPVGSGYSVEAQATGEETTAGLQFEIIRLDPPLRKSEPDEGYTISIFISDEKTMDLSVNPSTTLGYVRGLVADAMGLPVNDLRLLYAGKHLDYNKTLHSLGITSGATLCSWERLFAGGCSEMALAVGGRIRQNINEHRKTTRQKTNTITFNVQILNSASFQSVTGRAPPPTPISAETYASYGFPFFTLSEEPTSVSGDFSSVQSIGQIDKTADPALNFPTVDAGTGLPLTDAEVEEVGFLNPKGAKRQFKFVWEMAQDINRAATTAI